MAKKDYPELEVFKGNLPKTGYIFSRTSLEPAINLDQLAESNLSLIQSSTYYVSQIDTLAFSELLELRPVQALVEPPLTDKEIF